MDVSITINYVCPLTKQQLCKLCRNSAIYMTAENSVIKYLRQPTIEEIDEIDPIQKWLFLLPEWQRPPKFFLYLYIVFCLTLQN